MNEKSRFVTTEIVSGFVHDLNNALSLLMLRMETIEDLLDNPEPEALKKAYSDMETAFEKLNAMIAQQASPYQRPITDDERKTDLGDFAGKLMNALEHIARVQGVELLNQVSSGPSKNLVMPRQLFEMVIQILELIHDSKTQDSKKKLTLKNSGEDLTIHDSEGQELGRL